MSKTIQSSQTEKRTNYHGAESTNWITKPMHIKGILILANNMHSLYDTDRTSSATGLGAYPGDLHVSSKDIELPRESMQTPEGPWRRPGTCFFSVDLASLPTCLRIWPVWSAAVLRRKGVCPLKVLIACSAIVRIPNQSRIR